MGKYFHEQFTITDVAKPLTANPLIFEELDIQIQDNAIKKGDMNSQTLSLVAGDVQSFRSSTGVDLRPMFFKNAAPGSIAKITIDGSLID